MDIPEVIDSTPGRGIGRAPRHKANTTNGIAPRSRRTPATDNEDATAGAYERAVPDVPNSTDAITTPVLG